MSDLSGKIILVTGAARGIGAAVAKAAEAAGAEGLVLTDRDELDAQFDCPTEIALADLSDPLTPKMLMAAGRGRFGRIDGLVNAAGLTTRASFLDCDLARWEALMAVNLRAPFFLMSEFIQHANAGAAIVNIQSMNAHCGAPDLAIYSATKGALQTLTKNAAHAHMADRIRVNGINLGWVPTASEDHLQSVTLGHGPNWQDAVNARVPLGRLVSEEEAARWAVHLLSDASAPMTGVSMDLEQWIAGAPPGM